MSVYDFWTFLGLVFGIMVGTAISRWIGKSYRKWKEQREQTKPPKCFECWGPKFPVPSRKDCVVPPYTGPNKIKAYNIDIREELKKAAPSHNIRTWDTPPQEYQNDDR